MPASAEDSKNLVRMEVERDFFVGHEHGIPVDLMARPGVRELCFHLLTSIPTIQSLACDGDLTASQLAHIGRLSQLEHLTISAAHLGDEKLASATLPTQLKHLNLGGIGYLPPPSPPRFTGEGFKVVQRLPVLESLSVRGQGRYTSKGFEYLSAGAMLQNVDLSFATIHERELAQLRAVRQLRKLCLSGTSILDTHLSSLAGHATLQALDLSQTQILGPGFRELHLPALRSLTLIRCKLRELPLDLLPALASVNIGQSEVSRSVLHGLSGMQRLEELHLACVPHSDAIFDNLQMLLHLKVLDVCYTPVTNSAVRRLENHPSLESIYLARTKVTKAVLASLETMPRLRHVNLSGTGIRPEEAQSLASSGRSVVFDC